MVDLRAGNVGTLRPRGVRIPHVPIANTLIEIWHANDDGCYSINQDCETTSEDLFNLRGSRFTGPAGEYAFETVLPGHYSAGNTTRPRHIHLLITSPDGTELITQLYFEGDEWIDGDPWANQATERAIPLVDGEA